MHAEIVEQLDRLERPAHPGPGPLVRAEPVDALSAEGDRSLGTGNEAAERVDRGRLAGAVGSDEAHDRVVGDRDRHVVDGHQPTEADARVR